MHALAASAPAAAARRQLDMSPIVVAILLYARPMLRQANAPAAFFRRSRRARPLPETISLGGWTGVGWGAHRGGWRPRWGSYRVAGAPQRPGRWPPARACWGE